jgi:hypothetical protein
MVKVEALQCLDAVYSVWAESMVRVRVRVAVCVAVAFSVWTQFTVQTGKRSELPRGMPLLDHKHGRASSEHAWDPMASSSANFCRKTRTVQIALLGVVPLVELISAVIGDTFSVV